MTEFIAESVPNTKGDLCEGLLWDERSGTLMWSDIFKNTIMKWKPGSDSVLKKEFKTIMTSIGKNSTGGYVVAAGNCVQLLDENLEVTDELSLEMPNQNVRTNDGNIDPSGNFWIGSMAYDAKARMGDLKKVSSDFQSQTILRDVTISNGIDWSPDGEILYYIDTPTKKVSRFKFDLDSASLGQELEPIDVSASPGAPDGMCTDAAGNLWVAFWGGGQVRNFSPEGELLGVVNVAASLVTNCAFGGADLSTLYITTADASHDPSITGREPLGGSLFLADVRAKGKLQYDFIAS
jgi:sugar lactone lactonase YvrE